ncbi:MAG TPA: LysR family transcriptional regulator [Rhizomicrobium sp.]|jgi:DNA-binding transcriptional LysR family regulator
MFTGTLRAFDEVVRAGSIRKASAVLGVAPSSVSRNVALLEREMGTRLLDRRAAGIELTHAGRLVADYGRSVLLEYDALRTDLDDMRGTQRKHLRLAMVESVVLYGPMKAVSRFSERFASVSFNIRLMTAPSVIAAVQEGLCDIGVGYCAEPRHELAILASVSEPVVLALRPDHPLARAKQVELKDIAGLRLALPDPDFGVRRMFDRACAEARVPIVPVLSSNVFETLRDFARYGSGAAVLPKRAVARDQLNGDLVAIPLHAPVFRKATIDVVVLRKRRLPRILKSFADALIDQIRASPV